MNVITDLGNFLIMYAPYVETALIVLGAAVAVVVVVSLIKGSRKKTKLLTDINDNVEKINTAVNHINDKSKDVIYIDNRSREDNSRAEEIKTEKCTEEEVAEEQEVETSESGETETPEEEKDKEKIEAPKKFMTRDCAVSKQGKEYTLEELIEQIQK